MPVSTYPIYDPKLQKVIPVPIKRHFEENKKAQKQLEKKEKIDEKKGKKEAKKKELEKGRKDSKGLNSSVKSSKSSI